MNICISDNKTSLLTQCIKVLQILPSKRTYNDITLLLQLAEAIAFFKNLAIQNPEIVEKCMQVLRYKIIKRDETLFSVGDSGSLFYIILKGSVSVNIRLPSPDEPKSFQLKEVNILRAGNSFGELALLNDNAKRTATIISKEDCIFATMEKHHFQSILGAQEQQKVQDKISFIGSFPFLQSWSFREIKTLSYHFEPQLVNLNQIIIKQGDCSSNLYIIKEGQFELIYTLQDPLKNRQNSQIHSICMLGSGEFFGEESFLLDDNMTFTLKFSNIQEIKMAQIKGTIQCKTQFGKILRISRDDIVKRFWDEKTQTIFINLLQSIHQFRINKIKQYDLNNQKIKTQLENDQGIDQFIRPFTKQSVQKYNTLTKRISLNLKQDKEYQYFKNQEQLAFEQFKKLFQDRNCSYNQVKTFFDSKTLNSQHYFDKNSYSKLFFRFPQKQRRSQQLNTSISYTLKKINNETPQSTMSKRTQLFIKTHKLGDVIINQHFKTENAISSNNRKGTQQESQGYIQFKN